MPRGCPTVGTGPGCNAADAPELHAKFLQPSSSNLAELVKSCSSSVSAPKLIRKAMSFLRRTWRKTGTPRAAPRLDQIRLAAAHIHQQADGQRQVGFSREIFDALRFAVFEDVKSSFFRLGIRRALLVAHRCQDVDHIDIHLNGRRQVLILVLLLRNLGDQSRRKRHIANNSTQSGLESHIDTMTDVAFALLFHNGNRHPSPKAADPVLARIIERVGDYGINYREPTFETLVQLHRVSAAERPRGEGHLRPARGGAAGGRITPDGIMQTTSYKMRALGLSRQKTAYIRDLARRARAERLCSRSSASWRTSRDRALTEVKGIGVWTVHMFLIFALRRPNVLPTGDLGIRSAIRKAYGLPDLPKPKEIERWPKLAALLLGGELVPLAEPGDGSGTLTGA